MWWWWVRPVGTGTGWQSHPSERGARRIPTPPRPGTTSCLRQPLGMPLATAGHGAGESGGNRWHVRRGVRGA
eukprot:114387-Prymnesium_polylepis.1